MQYEGWRTMWQYTDCVTIAMGVNKFKLDTIRVSQ
jgi:hypothetical protein